MRNYNRFLKGGQVAQLEKLKMNEHKSDLENQDLFYVFRRMEEELEELRQELSDVVCKLKKMKIEPNFGKCPKSTSAKKDLQDRSNGPIQNFITALMKDDVDTIHAIASEKNGFYPTSLMDGIFNRGILTTNDLRRAVGDISKGKWTYETVRKLMPPVRPTKYNGFMCWKVKKRP